MLLSFSFSDIVYMWEFSAAEITLYVLTHCSRETRKRVLSKQCRPRSDAENAASDQGLHCLQIV